MNHLMSRKKGKIYHLNEDISGYQSCGLHCKGACENLCNSKCGYSCTGVGCKLFCVNSCTYESISGWKG